MTPAEEFAEVAARFGEVVAGVRPEQWDDPAPVPDWTARDVVRHLVEWFPALTHGLPVAVAPGPSVDDDPAGAWSAFQRGVQDLLDDPDSAALVPTNPNFGGVPLGEAVTRFFSTDVFMHTWDLARATGQDATLDPERCAAMLSGMEPIDDLLRQSGQYGPRIDVGEDADVQTRMLGFIGRDPLWRPPARA
ncbi:TIGR03086 family protein [Nocardioides anomalus]|uniref:TIGR03086 family protein n=1 Tax=Nocardioides anomalus TaxID=2712223 RepID=A0A6G6WJT0_9ACTN|nr:TIGR03086 family metal-binding protein [Nocardioides anomalus]QIG45456.1 TIGR03086 family protein [Nocardioides anomalus]